MEITGLVPYDLAGNWCEECGQAKMNRLLGFSTNCRTCREVLTRHRCTDRPDIDELELGRSWECPECGSTWAVTEKEDWCGECGRPQMVKTWDVTPGDRIATAPRYEPPLSPLAPFRNLFVHPAVIPPSLPRSCYRKNGFMVHVKPGCRCSQRGTSNSSPEIR